MVPGRDRDARLRACLDRALNRSPGLVTPRRARRPTPPGPTCHRGGGGSSFVKDVVRSGRRFRISCAYPPTSRGGLLHFSPLLLGVPVAEETVRSKAGAPRGSSFVAAQVRAPARPSPVLCFSTRPPPFFRRDRNFPVRSRSFPRTIPFGCRRDWQGYRFYLEMVSLGWARVCLFPWIFALQSGGARACMYVMSGSGRKNGSRRWIPCVNCSLVVDLAF